MPATVYTSAVITLNAALYGYAPSNTVFNTEVATAAQGINAYANGKVSSSMSNADLSALVLGNMGLLPNADLNTALTQVFALNSTARGQVIMNLASLLSGLTGDATYGAAANAWNAASAQAYAYSSAGTASAVPVPFMASGVTFVETLSSAAGADVMRLTGDQDVRIDFTDMLKQIRGLDLNGDGTIANDGKENNSPLGANSALTNHPTDNKFEIVDAYRRDAFNDGNKGSNFLGDIAFDGTGFGGDGVATNGNIFLGGLGHDTASGGTGNDFLAGGGIAQGHGGTDVMYGMRNADFFFAEFSGLDATDGGPSLRIDGGITSDSDSAGTTQTTQDSDWLLFEASDDDEPVQIWLNNDNGTVDNRDGVDGLTDGMGRVLSRTGESMQLDDVENVDASGNLYGFLKNIDVQLGGRNGDSRDPAYAAGSANNGQGSSAQLMISGSDVANKIIGGFDNDFIEGRAGNDLLMGGNVKSYIANGTTIAQQLLNPNLLTIANDGRDELRGDAGNDGIVFEADKGVIDGGADSDTLWLTANSLGTSATGVLAADNRLRFDLAASTLANSAGYGGADVDGTQDQTLYGTAAGTGRVTVTNMESVIATGLGAVDFAAAGSNTPELVFDNQQNFQRYTGSMDLRGQQDGTANTLYASNGTDVVEGRGGNDKLSGGEGDDDFVFFLQDGTGDGVDVIHRQADANNDNLWDGYNAVTGSGGTFVQDFGQVSAAITANSKLTLTLVDTAHPADLTGFPVNGVAFKLDGVSYTVALTTGVQGTYDQFVAGLNSALDANPALIALDAVLNADKTITITDPAGKTFVSVGYTWVGNVTPPAGTLTWNQAVGGPAVTQTLDRLVYRSYEDRLDNESVDDDAITGSIVSLGRDAYAEDLVINFAADGTRISEDQSYSVDFTNLTTQDKVSVNVNGVTYTLQVGVDLDGNSIALEDGVGADTQTSIQHNFLNRYIAFINSFMDDDTASGKVVATARTTLMTAQDLNSDGDATDVGENTGAGVPATAIVTTGFTLTQAVYNTEETVFMTTPVVTLSNLSNGEAPSVTVANTSQHEVLLYNYDGRNLDGAGKNLDETNVLFWGDTNTQRSILQTANNLTGGTITGKNAVLVDGGADDLAGVVQNLATNANLALNFTVHGDDFILGGAGLDTINAGTGDDRVQGSRGTDVLDGGKNLYAVQVLGETEARVVTWNVWEAANNTSAQSLLADPTLAGKVISSKTLIDQTESGATPVVGSGVFDDTLIYAQSDFNTGATRFTVTLDNYTVSGGVVSLNNGGAGHVTVDLTGDGATADDSTSAFSNFENVRTVSGTGLAVAGVGGGQGNDTLNVSALSTATGGIEYDLTNRADGGVGSAVGAGKVSYSANAHASLTKPAEADFESLVMKVDGVESVIAGLGDDLVVIDETEASKDNSFSADLGDDRIDYQNDFTTAGGAWTAAEAITEPTVTVKVNTAADTDQVTMTNGRVGALVATDTLTSVEYITVNTAGHTANGSRENDVVDVTRMTTGAVVSYLNGAVTDLAGVEQVRIEGIARFENVWADGNDTVLVASAAAMSGLNATSDAGTAAGTDDKDIALATFVDFDTLSAANARVAFLSQTTAQIEDTVNQNQYTFNLSKTGSGVDTDTVDYSNAIDNIAVVVELDATRPNQYVMVDSDGAAFFDAVGDLEEANDRIDVLVSAERIVAAQGESVLDLSASTKGLEIKFNSAVVSERVAGNATTNAYDVTSVRISDLASSSPLSRSYIEYRDSTDAALVDLAGATNKATATWDRIEGSDNAEKVILNSAHSVDTNAFNLRGGANEVKYNELTKSITFSMSVSDFVATNALNTGKITGTVTFQDGTGAGVESTVFLGGTHTITSYTANNAIAAGSLRIAASQDAEDNLKLSGLDSKMFLVSEIGTVDNQITLKLGSGAAQNSVVLTGFELVTDSESNDVYDFGSVVNAVAGLNFIDNATADHDTIKVGNDAVTALSTPTAISLAGLNALPALAPAGFDFDVLDVTKVTDTAVTTLTGVTAGEGTDEVVIGNFQGFTTVQFFESVVLTQDAVAQNGTTYSLDTTGNKLVAGAKTLTFNNDMNTLSFGGTALEGTYGANTSLNATGNLVVTVVGNESVTLIGGNGNDSLTSKGGNDRLTGGAGNDTLDGGRVAAVGEVTKITLGGGAAVLSGAETLTLDGSAVAGALTIGGSGAGTDLVTASATADADQIGALLVAQTTTFLETELGYAAGSIASVAYDASSNVFTINFTVAAGNVFDTTAVVSAGTMTAVAATTAGTPAVESQDTYVFEATAALNGVDAINNFNGAAAATDDILDFSAFLGIQGAAPAAAVNLGTGDITVLNGGVAVGFNKGSLAAANVVTAGTVATGEIILADNGKAVVLVTADTDGVADLVSTQAYDVYYVEDTDTAGATQAFTVTKVATINGAAELDGNNVLIEGLVLGSNAANVINQSAAAAGVTILGGGGNDTITGSAFADTINGGAGNDTVTPGLGADTVTTGAGQDTVVLTEGVASADNLIWANAFAGGNAGAATVTDFAWAAGVDTIDIQVNVLNGVTAATSALVAIVPVATASNGTATANDVIFTFAGGGDILAAGTTLATAIANAVTALTSTTDFSSANIVAGDSLILQMNDGTNTFVYHYVASGVAAVTEAGDLTLIGMFNGTTAALTGDFI